MVGLLGPNGAGKTTTFHMMVGLTRPDSGTVLLGGENVTQLPMYERARRGISYLPQEPSIFRKLTVEENLLAILETLALTTEERADRLRQLLDELGVATGEEQSTLLVGRRAAAGGDHACARSFTIVHAPRRTVCGHRSDCCG